MLLSEKRKSELVSVIYDQRQKKFDDLILAKKKSLLPECKKQIELFRKLSLPAKLIIQNNLGFDLNADGLAYNIAYRKLEKMEPSRIAVRREILPTILAAKNYKELVSNLGLSK